MNEGPIYRRTNKDAERERSSWVSQPERIYDRLENPQTDDIGEVESQLIGLLGLETSGATLEEISTALTTQTGILGVERSGYLLASHVIDMLRQYPWLRSVCNNPELNLPLTAWELGSMAGNHAFDDYFGLFGISVYEGNVLRGEFQARSDQEALRAFSQELGIPYKNSSR
jgi:hypothetical protein